MFRKKDTTFFENKLLDFVTAKDPMLEMFQWVMDKFMEIEVAHKTGAEKKRARCNPYRLQVRLQNPPFWYKTRYGLFFESQNTVGKLHSVFRNGEETQWAGSHSGCAGMLTERSLNKKDWEDCETTLNRKSERIWGQRNKQRTWRDGWWVPFKKTWSWISSNLGWDVIILEENLYG